MITVVRSRLTHRCPYVDEVDHGSIEITFAGAAPELHELARRLAACAEESVTHEGLTERLAVELKAVVVTRWRTAGLDVEVRACGS